MLGDLGSSQSHELAFGIENTQDHLTLVLELRLSKSLGPLGKTGLSFLRSKAQCVRRRLLGYPTSVVEEVGDEFISVRENLISRASFWD